MKAEPKVHYGVEMSSPSPNKEGKDFKWMFVDCYLYRITNTNYDEDRGKVTCLNCKKQLEKEVR